MTYPVHLEIESTNRCNLSCIMCPHKDMKRPQGDMSMETLKKIVDESRGRTKTCYLHQIGEPLFNKNLDRMIAYTAAAGIRTSISTNGMLLDAEWTNRLLICGLDEIIFCVDGFTEQDYLKYRKGGDWKRVISNYFHYVDEHYRVNSKTEIIIQGIKVDKNYKINSVKNFEKSLGCKKAQILLKDFSTFAGNVKDLPGDTPPRRFTCSYPWNHLAVHWNGDLCLCCRDFEGFTKMGNINETSIEEIFNSVMYEQYRGDFKDKKWENVLCKNC